MSGMRARGAAGMALGGMMLFSAGCSARFLPTRLARAFHPAPSVATRTDRSRSQPLRAPSAVDRAIKMQTRGAFDPLRDDARLRSLRDAVQAEPTNLLARLQLAQRYEGYGLADYALDEYMSLTRAAAGAESALRLQSLLGVARLGQQADRAAEATEIILQEQAATDSADLSLQLGLLYERLGEVDKAEAAYRAAVAQSPALSSAHNNLGYRLLRRGDLAAAEQQFRMAIDTGSLAARNNLGMLLTQRGDYTAAWQQFQAGSLDAAAARNNFAVALMSAGKWLEGREQLLLALRERRGYGPALRNFRIVQRHISGE